MKNKFVIAAIAILSTLQYGCTTVKPYQKMYLNDEEMNLGVRSIDGGEVAFQSYREGASGANGGKVGGGCGCN
ncbi:MAG: DUF4266 domain-containing protein [Crocinitomicaceae bacterium]|nr:DUF4266 domain-containing protein [Crocinitomicaceae bacterium]